MASKVTHDDIKRFNELYYKCRNFAEVARITGFSSSTVSKYVDRNWKPVDQQRIAHFTLDDLPEPNLEWVANYSNLGDVCELTEAEKEEIQGLWEEIAC